MALVAARVRRRRAGRRMPVHFKHTAFRRGGAGDGKARQRYVERPTAAGVLDRYEGGENEGQTAALGNLRTIQKTGGTSGSSPPRRNAGKGGCNTA
jgi:hypothetical protein